MTDFPAYKDARTVIQWPQYAYGTDRFVGKTVVVRYRGRQGGDIHAAATAKGLAKSRPLMRISLLPIVNETSPISDTHPAASHGSVSHNRMAIACHNVILGTVVIILIGVIAVQQGRIAQLQVIRIRDA